MREKGFALPQSFSLSWQGGGGGSAYPAEQGGRGEERERVEEERGEGGSSRGVGGGRRRRGRQRETCGDLLSPPFIPSGLPACGIVWPTLRADLPLLADPLGKPSPRHTQRWALQIS